MDERVYITTSPLGIVIGRLQEMTGERITLRSPRVIIAQNAKQGVVLSFQVIYGNPESVTLPISAYWEVMDKEMIKMYIKEVTNITLVH